MSQEVPSSLLLGKASADRAKQDAALTPSR
jgi:hypothetical protein